MTDEDRVSVQVAIWQALESEGVKPTASMVRAVRAKVEAMLDNASLTPTERTLLSLVNTMREYLPPDGISKDEFINRVLGVLDNDEMAELVGELEAGK